MTKTKENERLTELLKMYLGHNAGTAVASGGTSRGQSIDLTAAILVADIRGSTPMIESMSTERYLNLLNNIFDTIVPAVTQHGGEVLQFTGDGMLAVFPESREASHGGFICSDAVADAFSAASEGNDALLAEAVPAHVAFGLSYGPVSYGNVGTKDRLTFTVISAEVSLADRLQRLCPIEKTNIAMSAPFAGALPKERTRSLGFYSLKGFEKDKEVFRPVLDTEIISKTVSFSPTRNSGKFSELAHVN